MPLARCPAHRTVLYLAVSMMADIWANGSGCQYVVLAASGRQWASSRWTGRRPGPTGPWIILPSFGLILSRI
eukprot:1014943-Rhodomonas_salina.1